ncbi:MULTISPECIES: SDR family NAD(P)-dependent oxidoreductase [Paenibacillus]|uniref:SDR family NAD(P)-dependent oxidoreductase n=1 Tax=Paenibacillus TaxID=44249 RepID=UPI0022B93083|nr:SDR family NAD(P)-dependent oxidoreductase [Paenibacillus caseinilyticus]MCZ8519623.1 SDR family NAD(P)-dependent oxidoreductase [Paenibacillus caseinilyticus]
MVGRTENDIAIIGLACRFPGAQNAEEFWENLKAGRSSIEEIPKSRWDWETYWGDPQKERNKSSSKWGGFIQDADLFDPGFFGLSAREVEATDPQQRIMLQLAWACLEDAGVVPSRVSGQNIGVYMGVFNFDYKGLQESKERTIETYHSIGTASAVIANRISHYFNFKGPSFPIDTACSSSFNAIHSAAQSILLGECSMALAGGVNLILTPTRHISFSKAGMLSPTGSCKTFDDSADGYVRSEGAGTVLLKPLQQALEDGDSIYGVLKGSAVNHNGRTHTLTYPNPQAQADVIVEAHRRAGIPVESVSYIEAHGTGTPKGDPLEFQGLQKAFEELGSAAGQALSKNYCGLGSVKTNIGHLESAAGIAGVVKVLMSMKHKQLPGLAGFRKLNHRIAIEESPFYMVDSLREWNPPLNREGLPYPRRAGISSFGFGGTNAHVVLEEAPSGAAEGSKASAKYPAYQLICLSAKTEEALLQKQEDLARWLDMHGEEQPLAAVSATLLHRREHFGVRAAYVVQDPAELRDRLEEVLRTGEAEGYARPMTLPRGGGKERPLLERLARLLTQELQAGTKLPAEEYRGHLLSLAELYVQGVEADWRVLVPEKGLPPLHLPTYPFARERYWIPEEEEAAEVPAGMVTRAAYQLHPLLHRNTSDFTEQRFTSVFSGREFFLKDHIVKERRVLPGVAYMEMARAAAAQSLGTDMDTARLSLSHIVWARPIVVGDSQEEVHIGLYPEDNGEITFEVYTGKEDEPDLHSRGAVLVRSSDEHPVEAPRRYLEEIQAGLTRSPVTTEQYYEGFRQLGLAYGPAHQGVDEVYTADESLLARLLLPPLVKDTADQYVLHPSLMDAALQAALILLAGSPRQGSGGWKGMKLFLPFALEELEVLGSCTPSMWAHVQYSGNHGSSERGRTVDIDLFDEEGTVRVRMRGLVWREAEEREAFESSPKRAGLFLLAPYWKTQEAVEIQGGVTSGERLIVLCGTDPLLGERLAPLLEKARVEEVRVLDLTSSLPGGVAERYEACAAALLEAIQSRLRGGSDSTLLIQVVAAGEKEERYAGLAGLLQTAQLENPRIAGQVIEVEAAESPESLAAKLKESSSSRAGRIRYRGAERFVLDWKELETPPSKEEPLPWKDGGIYLITGGAGGLGRLFAKEIAGHAKSPCLILTGRSPLHPGIQTALEELSAAGARAEYVQVDVSDEGAVEKLFEGIRASHGQLHGILHSAGMIKDNYMLKKTAGELREVLAPKVAGLIHIDQASKGFELDFFVMFSSVFGAMGNPGQADYCTANAYMDTYAAYRSTLVGSGERSGRTLSLNWPLWASGGMHVDPAAERLMRENLGMAALPTSSGMRAFYQALAAGTDQVLVLEGELELFRPKLTGQPGAQPTLSAEPAPASAPVAVPVPEMAGEALEEKAAHYLKTLISSVLKLPVQRIDTDAPMEEYGIDSIMTTQLTHALEKAFGTLSKTLFFEYQTLRELTGYFLKAYREPLLGLLGPAVQVPARPVTDAATAAAASRTEEAPAVKRSRSRARFAAAPEVRQTRAAARHAAEDVAIIGVSGRYPGAEGIREYWDVLRNGRDCITEIPPDRWDYSAYFDEDRDVPGKTYSKWGGFLRDVDKFDPLFFQIPPREAERMDPQERLFLQCMYETLEDAGYTRDTLAKADRWGLEGNVGVYVGVMYEEYQLYGAQAQLLGQPLALYGLPASVANRVSYFCNFHGPSITVDTMCSSSLTAIHLACQSLQRGECEAAIAGGVNISIHPNKYLLLAQGRFISGKGRCESFGEGGDGYVPSEGVGAVLLKPLSRAIADGDQIYGVIKATAVNHGGKTNGYTVPNPNAQASVIGRALGEAGIDPRTISYMEAHGTGTSLGDPIEIAGLTNSFRRYTEDTQFCAIGSAKSNIGHCESAAGIAGLTKVLLQLKYKQIVPSLHSEVLNPRIDFSATPFVVQQELAAWNRPLLNIDGQSREYPRIAGLSSFGAGGSNAHILIQEYDGPDSGCASGTPGPNPAIIVLSAKSAGQLHQQAERLLAEIRLQQWGDERLTDIAYTLQLGREAMEERLAVLASTMKELEEKLTGFVEGRGGMEDLYVGQVKRSKEALSVFARDEELQEALAKWMQRGKYAKLASLWVQGLSVDWSGLYGGRKPRRMSLPVYPFAKERCWAPDFDLTPMSPGSASAVHAYAKQDRPSHPQREMGPLRSRTCMLTKQWEPAPAALSRSVSRTIAILMTPATLELAVTVSRHFANTQMIDVGDMDRLLARTDTDWPSYEGCIDLAGCSEWSTERTAWLTWLQKLIEHGPRDGLMLLGVTKDLEALASDGASGSSLYGAERAGLYRMLQSEYGRLQSRHVDVSASTDLDTLAEQIAGEFRTDSPDAEVIFRGGVRYRAYLKELPAGVGRVPARHFPEGHTLLITGGTRGIGYLCARHFVEKYGVRKLVLTGREALPPRETWNETAGHPASTMRKIQDMQALESLGAQVITLAVDLTNEQDVRRAVSEMTGTLGPVGGVIHCAGVMDTQNPAFIRKSEEGIREVWNPKIPGLRVLYQSLKGEPLQWFLLFSSVSAILPGLGAGQSDYAAANAYMDYFSASLGSGSPVVSIQWPSWKDTGMGEVRSRVYERTGLLSMTNEEGLKLLDQLLAGELHPVVLPAVVDADQWKPGKLMQFEAQETRQQGHRPQPAQSAGRGSGQPAGSLPARTQAWLTDLLAEELKIDAARLDTETTFQEYGVDSIMLVQMLRKINEQVNEEMEPTLLFEYPSIESLSAWLVDTHGAAMAELLDSPVEPRGAESLHQDHIQEQAQAQAAPLVFDPIRSYESRVGVPKHEQAASARIAVVGLSCRFPGADSLDGYWELLSEGRSAIRQVPASRWGRPTPYYAGVLEDISGFDPSYFLIPESDAQAMDPQALLALEETLKLLCHAGYTSQEVKGKAVGVYLGARSQHRPERELLLQARNPIVAVGPNYLAANISQFFDLRGPSVVVDTACSSALVGMQMAVQALLSGDIESAIVGGVSLLTTPGSHGIFEQRGILSSSQAFHLFDGRADGIVPGEGAGMVLLKTEEQAIADGDCIYAVISGIAVNNDGRTAGPASPNVKAQREVMETALRRSGRRAEQIQYVEANGSGTEVTDMLELKAIQAVYRSMGGAPLGLGSMKPNIGHPLCAEGIASFIKVVLMLRHGQFVPFISAEQPMSHYDLAASPFYFSRAADRWNSSGAPRAAAVNCFADGGTNVHLIVEEGMGPETGRPVRQPLPVPFLQRKPIGRITAEAYAEPVGAAAGTTPAMIWETLG